MSELHTKKWFLDRIGKKVYLDSGSVVIFDIQHATYLHKVSEELGIQYHDTKSRCSYYFVERLSDICGEDSYEMEELAYPMSYWKELMVEKGLKELNVVKAERVTGSQFFYCLAYCEVAETGDCGSGKCDKYIPNNGHGGRCKNYGYCYEKTDEVIKIEL